MKSLQLCSSPTHPADACRSRQIPVVLHASSKLAISDMQPDATMQSNASAPPLNPTLLVCEPFHLVSDVEAEHWRESFIKPQLLHREMPCLFLAQPLLALLAHA